MSTYTAVHATSGSSLRTVLRVDGVSTMLFGVLLVAGGSLLSDPLGLPVRWSLPLGIGMLAGAALLLWIAARPSVSPGLALTVTVGNGVCAIGMVALAVSGVIDLTGLGVAFMLVGALVVAVFTEFEYLGYRQVART
ncbi:hypothetical protein [Streptomyces profundus]|uniref:hypothetical protein n=1 Tax=Streptomyces profundus TaxID=2867410 RepID=UPI001D16A9B9|nr:hypothetical protein [Streptomyces sp. MA3_2.13]UED84196.1 hypothetical protein K4G22_08210 [Streptomyces sp. MA3_2.13]